MSNMLHTGGRNYTQLGRIATRYPAPNPNGRQSIVHKNKNNNNNNNNKHTPNRNLSNIDNLAKRIKHANEDTDQLEYKKQTAEEFLKLVKSAATWVCTAGVKHDEVYYVMPEEHKRTILKCTDYKALIRKVSREGRPILQKLFAYIKNPDLLTNPENQKISATILKYIREPKGNVTGLRVPTDDELELADATFSGDDHTYIKAYTIGMCIAVCILCRPIEKGASMEIIKLLCNAIKADVEVLSGYAPIVPKQLPTADPFKRLVQQGGKNDRISTKQILSFLNAINDCKNKPNDEKCKYIRHLRDSVKQYHR